MKCKIENCDKKHEAHGLCKVHYNRAVRLGEIKTKQGRGRPRIYTEEERMELDRRRSREKYKRWKEKNPTQHISKTKNPCYSTLANAKSRAKRGSLPINIELSDLNIPEVCPLLGIPLVREVGDYSDNSPTLDRIVPSLGYIKGNIQIISMRANRIKNNATFEEFESIYLNWKRLAELL